MTSQCSSLERDVDDYQPRPFQNSNMIVLGRRGVPRFGFPSGIEKTVNGNVDEAASYLTGVVVCSLCIFSFFLCWVIALIVLRCLGPRRVGIYSGVKLPLPKRPEHAETYISEIKLNDHESNERVSCESMQSPTELAEQTKADLAEETTDEEINENASTHQRGGRCQLDSESSREHIDKLLSQRWTEWELSVKQHQRQLARIRITVLVCGSLVVISVLTMVIAGIMNLSDASKTMTEGLDKARNIALSGAILIEDFLRNQNLLIRNIQSYRATMNAFCPQIAEAVCEQLSPISNCNFTRFSESIRVFLWDIFIDLGTYTFFELTSIQNDLINTADSISSIKQGVNGFTWAFWTACVWALLLMIFTMFLMYGVILAWCEDRRQSFLQCVVTMMHHWLVVPLYIFFVFLTWVFSMIFVIGTVVTADFCYDSPDNKILTTIDANRESFSELGVEFATYYVSGCPESGLPNEMKSKSDLLIQFLLKVSEFGAALQSDDVIEICGDTSRFKGVGAALEAATCNLANTLLDVQDYFACRNFHPVYEATVYEALCYEANRGLTWVAFTQILIVFFSMIMLMLRVAFVEVHEDSTTVNSDNRWNRIGKLLRRKRLKSLNEETSKGQILDISPIEIDCSKIPKDLHPNP